MTFSAYISDQNIFFEMTILIFLPDSVQCTTISLIKLQPSHGAVDFLRNLGAFRWENPNPDSCFYFKTANSLSKQKSLLRVKFKKGNSLEEKLADLVLLSSDKK